MKHYSVRTNGFARDNYRLLEAAGENRDTLQPNIRDLLMTQRMVALKHRKPRILKSIIGA